MTDPVIIRAMVPSDLAYVFSTWLRDLRDADPGGLPDDLWFPAHRALIERTLADRAVTVLVAAAADQPSDILGYAVADQQVLEWIHVRKQLREKGLAKRLLQQLSLTDPVQSRWTTSLARERIRHRPRGRWLRREIPRLYTAPRSES